MNTITRQSLEKANQVVVKCGTSSLTDNSGRLDLNNVHNICDQLNLLMESGITVTLVSSGAVGAGMGELNLSERPNSLPLIQAVAAVGQGQLMRAFHDAMEKHGKRVAQVLINRSDFENRARYLNIRNTMSALHERNILPIINENDAVSVDEIRFGDNDIIAALITNMIAADLLVLLTTVEGVMDGDQIVSNIHDIENAKQYLNNEKSRLGSGGMATKLAAAEMVTSAGEATVIASATTKDVLNRILAGENIGTFFDPSSGKLSSKKRWIGQAARCEGQISIDKGAATALTSGGKSLLPSGIIGIIGDFSTGDTISILSEDQEIARGLSNYSSAQLRTIMGKRSEEINIILEKNQYIEAIHRNNMVIF